jgi:hypothetical protein
VAGAWPDHKHGHKGGRAAWRDQGDVLAVTDLVWVEVTDLAPAGTDLASAAETDPDPAAETDLASEAATDPDPAAETDLVSEEATDPDPAAETDLVSEEATDPDPAAETDLVSEEATDPDPAAETDLVSGAFLRLGARGIAGASAAATDPEWAAATDPPRFPAGSAATDLV